MHAQTIDHQSTQPSSGWLKSYYYIRFAVAAAWAAAAFLLAKDVPVLAAVMLVAYPTWDAIANYIDARRTGGLGRNKTQMLNFIVSLITAIAVAFALTMSMSAVIAVFGVWATLAGLLQLATAVRRWKSAGAQWAMILSGAQSALAGVFFVRMAGGAGPIGIITIAPYAAVGAFYFLVSAIWLTVLNAPRKASRIAA